MRSPPKSPPAHTRSSSSIKPAGTAPWNSRSRPTLAPAVAAALTRAQQPRKYLAIHAPELAIEPHLQILRRYRRSLLLRLEHPHRPAMEDHVHRTARLGFNQSVILRIGIRDEKPLRSLVTAKRGGAVLVWVRVDWIPLRHRVIACHWIKKADVPS